MDKDIFEHAFALVNQKLDDVQIFSALKENDDTEKQIAILQIKDLKNNEQTEQLVNHLTGQDGPIREATAIKLRELVLEKKCKERRKNQCNGRTQPLWEEQWIQFYQ